MDDDFPLVKKIHLTYLAIFRPIRFLDFVRTYNPPSLDPYPVDEDFQRFQLTLVRSGWWGSLVLIVTTSVIGFLAGQILARSWPGSPLAVLLGGAGGVLILWATIGLRGWEVQTSDGTTLTEQVNRWVYRGTCTIGTLLLVISVFWAWP